MICYQTMGCEVRFTTATSTDTMARLHWIDR